MTLLADMTAQAKAIEILISHAHEVRKRKWVYVRRKILKKQMTSLDTDVHNMFCSNNKSNNNNFSRIVDGNAILTNNLQN